MNIINKRLAPYYILYTLIFNYAVFVNSALSSTIFLILSLAIAVTLFITGYLLNLREKEDNT